MIVCGLDVGGTKVEASFFELSDNVGSGTSWLKVQRPGKNLYMKQLGSKRIPTERILGYDKVIVNISNLLVSLADELQVNLATVEGIGIGLPGAVDPVKKAMSNGNTRIFLNKNLEEDLQKLLKLEIRVEVSNDANCFALAETLAGAGVQFAEETNKSIAEQSGIGLILGTGLGGGYIHHGQLIAGASGAAFEVGHTRLELNGGLPCYCGQSGCAEQYLSGTGLEAAYATRMYSQVKELPNSRKIFEMAEAQEPMALAVLIQYKKWLAKFLATIVNYMDPDYFVLGGGVSLQNFLYEGLEEAMMAHIYSPTCKPKIYQHQLGDSAGVVGAALLTLK